MRIPPFNIEILLESDPLRSGILVGRLAVATASVVLITSRAHVITPHDRLPSFPARRWSEHSGTCRKAASPWTKMHAWSCGVHTPIYLQIYQCIYLSIHLSIHLSMCIYIYIYIYIKCTYIHPTPKAVRRTGSVQHMWRGTKFVEMF